MKRRTLVLMVLLLALWAVSVACGLGNILAPRFTPTPAFTPTPTPPPYQLVCNITTDSYGFEIDGETGEATSSMNDTTSYHYGASGQVSAITVEINEELTYSNTKHTYKITGQISLNMDSNSVTYNVTATGDMFGDQPQTCKRP